MGVIVLLTLVTVQTVRRCVLRRLARVTSTRQCVQTAGVFHVITSVTATMIAPTALMKATVVSIEQRTALLHCLLFVCDNLKKPQATMFGLANVWCKGYAS